MSVSRFFVPARQDYKNNRYEDSKSIENTSLLPVLHTRAAGGLYPVRAASLCTLGSTAVSQCLADRGHWGNVERCGYVFGELPLAEVLPRNFDCPADGLVCASTCQGSLSFASESDGSFIGRKCSGSRCIVLGLSNADWAIHILSLSYIVY